MKRTWLARGGFLLGALLLLCAAVPGPRPEGSGPVRLLRVDCRARLRPQDGPLELYAMGDMEDPVLSETARIPREVVEALLSAMADGTERETLAPLVDDRELTQEAFTALTGCEVPEGGAVCAVQVDGDGDGVDDVAAEVYMGGSGGFTEFLFFQGQGDGTYRETSRFSSVIQEFGFIRCGDARYLVRTSYDYSTKYVDGLDLYLYRDGAVADARALRFAVDGYDRVSLDLAPGAERALAALEARALPQWLEENDWFVGGAAETPHEDGGRSWWSCDLDGDGTEERYEKYLWGPTTMWQVQTGNFDFLSGDFPALEEAVREVLEESEDLRYYTFWTDAVDGAPVAYLYFWAPDGYTVCAYRL